MGKKGGHHHRNAEWAYEGWTIVSGHYRAKFGLVKEADEASYFRKNAPFGISDLKPFTGR